MKDAVNIEVFSCKLKLNSAKLMGKPNHTLLALIGSHGFLEIALNQGNAAAKFKTKPGDKIKLLL